MRSRCVTIVGLGDSTTAGTQGFRSPLESPPNGEGNPESQFSFWMMQSHPEWSVLNRGINGQTAEEIRARLSRDVLEVRPAYAIILAGVNDIFGGQRAETVERHLAAMYADVLDAGIVPVAATVLQYNMATTRAYGGPRMVSIRTSAGIAPWARPSPEQSKITCVVRVRGREVAP